MYVRRSDVAAYIEARTFTKTRSTIVNRGGHRLEPLDKAPPCPPRCIRCGRLGVRSKEATWRPSPSARAKTQATARATTCAIASEAGRIPSSTRGRSRPRSEAKATTRPRGWRDRHGRNPADLLAQALRARRAPASSRSRPGASASSPPASTSPRTRRKMYGSHLRKIGETFGDRDPHSITAADVAEWVAEQAEDAQAGNGRAVPRLLQARARLHRPRAEPGA